MPTAPRYFYPRSPCGERPELGFVVDATVTVFLSTLSLRRATVLRKVPLLGIKYFYPRSPCGERPDSVSKWTATWNISIHALLAESDMGLDGRFKL